MRKLIVLGAIGLLGACSDKAATPPPPQQPAAAAIAPAPAAASTALSAEGIGALRFGMTLAQAEAAAGKATRPEPFDPACSMLRFAQLPKLRFMVENDVVTRADAESGAENALGVAVGDALAQVRAAHPEAVMSAHKYDTNGHYLTVPSTDGRAAIILEESGGKITKIRAGLQPAVAYVETCG